MTAPIQTARSGGWALLGALGLPLAFVALPLYVLLPNHYATQYQVPLATLGLLLLLVRLGDALIDPLLGRWCDRWLSHSPQRLQAWGAGAAVLLALGMVMLFFPHWWLSAEPVGHAEPGGGLGPASAAALVGLVPFAALALLACYLGYSTLSVAHQTWSTRLGGSEFERSRIVAWREGWGLLGVITASTLPSLLGIGSMVASFCVLLALAIWAWSLAQPPAPSQLAATNAHTPLWLPLQRPLFQRLLVVFLLNGIASAIPATLVLFFVQDRLQAPSGTEALFLGAYFLAAALGVPLWLRGVVRWGLVRCWLAGMALSVLVFMWTLTLGAGDSVAFACVCALSGLALGVDVVAPAALLTGVVAQSGDALQHEGQYLGWWQVATKLNLALASGLVLPALQWWGYTPGSRGADALWTLSLAYGLMPCLLKLLAMAALWRFRQSLGFQLEETT